MIAMRRSDVADLNGRARALTQASGQLGETTILVGDREIAVGDHIVTLRNAPGIGILNGTRGVVTEVDVDRREITLRTSTDVEVQLHSAYLDARDERDRALIDHGYAITGHKSQGMTTDRSHVLGTDELYREWGYVALSQGRRGNHLYLVAPSARDRDEIAPSHEAPRNPYQEAARNLLGSRAQRMALDQGPAELLTQPTAALQSERRALADQLDALTKRARIEREIEQIARQIASIEEAASATTDTDPRRRSAAVQAARRRNALSAREETLRAQLPDPRTLTPNSSQSVTSAYAASSTDDSAARSCSAASNALRISSRPSALGPTASRDDGHGTASPTASRNIEPSSESRTRQQHSALARMTFASERAGGSWTARFSSVRAMRIFVAPGVAALNARTQLRDESASCLGPSSSSLWRGPLISGPGSKG